ncbi:MAG: hypothetical protein MdMp024_1287 [Bacteroidales bacterium]
MENNKEMMETLRELAILDVELTKKGGPTIDGHLFDEILGREADILESFGLPRDNTHLKLIRFEEIPDEKELRQRIGKLEQLAAEYLSAPVKSPIEILKEAQKARSDAFAVLPELKIITHTYTIFVYEDILLTNQDTPENVWEELELVQKTDGLLTLLGIFGHMVENEDVSQRMYPPKLKQYNLKYLSQFVECKKGEKERRKNRALYKALVEEPICEEDYEKYGYLLYALYGFELTEAADIARFKELVKSSDKFFIREAQTLGELMQTVEGRKFWAENGFAFNGTFDLTDSKNLDKLNAYQQRRQWIIQYRQQFQDILEMMSALFPFLEEKIVTLACLGMDANWAEKIMKSGDTRKAIYDSRNCRMNDTTVEAYVQLVRAYDAIIHHTAPPINFGK